MARMRSSETSSKVHVTPSKCVVDVDGTDAVRIQHIEGTAKERRETRLRLYKRMEARERLS